MLDDHARGNGELAQAKARGCEVVEVHQRQVAAVQLIDVREQV
jgi:hypothetical protein